MFRDIITDSVRRGRDHTLLTAIGLSVPVVSAVFVTESPTGTLITALATLLIGMLLFVGQATAAYSSKQKLRSHGAAFNLETREHRVQQVQEVLRRALTMQRHAAKRVVLFGSLIHEGRTPADIDLMVELAVSKRTRKAAQRVAETIGPSLEPFGLPVHWEWFSESEPAAIQRFLENCGERGGYVTVWTADAR